MRREAGRPSRGRLEGQPMRLRTTLASCGALVATLVLASAASAHTPQPGPGTAPLRVVTAAGSAIDNSSIDEFGNSGGCAVAVAASREAFAAPPTGTGAGSGSFTVSGGPGQPGTSVCGGAPVSMRFDVRSVQMTGETATLTVVVTDADDPSIVGQTGTITADTAADRVDVAIGGRSGGF